MLWDMKSRIVKYTVILVVLGLVWQEIGWSDTMLRPRAVGEREQKTNAEWRINRRFLLGLGILGATAITLRYVIRSWQLSKHDDLVKLIDDTIRLIDGVGPLPPELGKMVPLGPETLLDFLPEQRRLVLSGQPLEFGPGLLYHGRDGLDEILLTGTILGDKPLTRVAHEWATGQFRKNAESPVIIVISTDLFNKLLAQNKASLKLSTDKDLGIADPYPTIYADLRIDDVEELWIDLDLLKRYLVMGRNAKSIQERDRIRKIAEAFNKLRMGKKLKVIPHLRHAEVDEQEAHKQEFECVGAYLLKRGLFEKMPLFKKREMPKGSVRAADAAARSSI